MSKDGDSYERPIAARGNLLTVKYAMCSNGTSPAKEFIEGRNRKEQARLAVLFKRMADVGRIHNQRKFKKLEGLIWEFKSDQIRILCF